MRSQIVAIQINIYRCNMPKYIYYSGVYIPYKLILKLLV